MKICEFFVPTVTSMNVGSEIIHESLELIPRVTQLEDDTTRWRPGPYIIINGGTWGPYNSPEKDGEKITLKTGPGSPHLVTLYGWKRSS